MMNIFAPQNVIIMDYITVHVHTEWEHNSVEKQLIQWYINGTKVSAMKTVLSKLV